MRAGFRRTRPGPTLGRLAHLSLRPSTVALAGMTDASHADVRIAARFGLTEAAVVRDPWATAARARSDSRTARSIFVRRYAEHGRGREAQVAFKLG